MPFELNATVECMTSHLYQDRFLAEYWQTKIRYEKLKKFCNKIEAAEMTGKVAPPHDCPLYLLQQQQSAMGSYLHSLEIRAILEDIDLNSFYDGTKE